MEEHTLTTQAHNHGLQPAPLPLRAVAAVVDVLVVLLWSTVVAALLVGLSGGTDVAAWTARLTYVGVLAYMTLAWGRGTSLGKALCGLRIVRADGRPVTLSVGAWRVVSYLIASVPAKIGLFAAIWHPQRRGWHDVLAGTMVVSAGKGKGTGLPSLPPGEGGPRESSELLAASPLPHSRRWALAALGVYVLAAVVFTWPLVARLGSHIPGGEILGLSEDGYVFLWDYWWVHKAWHEGLPVMHTNYIFWPQTVSLRFHTLMPLNGLLAYYPQGWIGLVPTYNLLLLFALVATAWACYGLALSVTRNMGASLLAGGVFAFSPYMMTHTLAHPNLTALYPLPVMLWFLLKAVQTRRWLWALGAGLALGVLGYCDWYGFLYGAMLAALVSAGLAVGPGHRRLALLSLVISGLLGALVTAPLLVPMLAEQVGSPYAVRPLARSVALAGDPALWVTPPFLGTLAGGLGRRMLLSMGYLVAEHTVYLGLATLILAAVGWRQRRQTMIPWAVGAIGMLMLSLGPYLRVAGRDAFPAGLVLLLGGLPGNGFDLPLSSELTSRLGLGLLASGGRALLGGERLWLPYQWVWHWLPMLKTASVPARMAQPALLCLAVMAAAGLAAAWSRPRWRLPLLLLAAWGVLEFLPLPYPLRRIEVSPFYHRLARQRAVTAVCETPLTCDLGAFQFYQTVHGKRLLAGHISRPPHEAFRYVRSNKLLQSLTLQQPMLPGRARLALTAEVAGVRREELARKFGANLQPLRRLGVGYLLVHPRMVMPADVQAVGRVMQALGVPECYRDESLIAYRLLPAGEDDHGL